MSEVAAADGSEMETEMDSLAFSDGSGSEAEIENNANAKEDVNIRVTAETENGAVAVDIRKSPANPVAKQGKNVVYQWTKKYHLQLLEALILSLIMLTVIGLYTIPTVFYALPSSSVSTVKKPVGNTSTLNCSQVEVYSGEVCRDVFTSLQMCYSGVTSPPPALNIPSLIDQQTVERNARNLVNGLPFLSPRQECMEAIIPFFCLSVFELCDSSNNLHTILREDCLIIRDDICAEEWIQALRFLGAGVLPVCEDLPDISDDCTGNTSSPPSLGSNPTIGSSVDRLVCSEGFYFDENGTQFCRPICGEYSSLPQGVLVFEKISISIAFAACIVMLILALTVQRDSLLTFPYVLFLYMCITMLISAFFVIIGFLNTSVLFCGSRDFINAIEVGSETPFCTITGFLFFYAIQQIAMWALLYAVFLLWGVVFPFSYRRLKTSRRIHYAHIISVILALIVPLPGPLIHLTDGYVMTLTPVFACNGRNLDHTYYTFALPLSVILAITTCLLVFIFWTILKEFVVKKLLTNKKALNVGEGEVKICILIGYIILLGVFGLAVHARAQVLRNTMAFLEEFEFLACEINGEQNCPHVIAAIDVLVIIVVELISFLPVVALLLSCNRRTLKKKFKAMQKHCVL